MKLGGYLAAGVLKGAGEGITLNGKQKFEEMMRKLDLDARAAESEREREFRAAEGENDRAFRRDLSQSEIDARAEEGRKDRDARERMVGMDIADRAEGRKVQAGLMSNRRIQPDADGNTVLVLPDGSTTAVKDPQGRPVPFRDKSESLDENRAINTAIKLFTKEDENMMETLDREGAAAYLQERGFGDAARAIKNAGTPQKRYNSMDEVKAAYRRKEITLEEAEAILNRDFPDEWDKD